MRTFSQFKSVITLNLLLPMTVIAAESVYTDTVSIDGVVVHMGCDEPSLISTLQPGRKRLVMAFDRDTNAVQQCRKQLAAEGLIGPASAVLLTGDRLPFPENSVNLIIAPRVLGIQLDEMQRVVVPGGTMRFKHDGRWVTRHKPPGDDIDDWTHFLYDSTNNAVSRDRRCGPADSLQWIDDPLWTRSHDFLSTFAVAVSDNGRLFSILDEAPVASAMIPPRWMLVCRDAFNGVVLWKREMTGWFDSMYPMRSGPNHLLRRLVAADGKVFVTLDVDAPVSILDAATGETIRELAGTEHTEEILYRGGCLYLAINPDSDGESIQYYKSRLQRIPTPAVPKVQKSIVAIDVDTGKELWRKADEQTRPVMELTLAVNNDRVLYATDKAIVCLDRKNGKTHWQVEVPVVIQRPTWSVPTLAIYKDVVLYGDRSVQPGEEKPDRETASQLENGGVAGSVTAFAVADGGRLWSTETHDGFHFPVEVFVANDRVWTGAVAHPTDEGFIQARDYRTGNVVFEREPDASFAVGHHRCHRNKATERFLVTGRGFVEWIDLETGRRSADIFLRGACSFGVLPANGLLYDPPDPCICGTERKLRGFCALASKQVSGGGFQVSGPVLRKGPAYKPHQAVAGLPTEPPARPKVSKNGGDLRSSVAAGSGDPRRAREGDTWPTYRHDNERSGVTPMRLSTPLEIDWQKRLSEKPLSSPVAAKGKLVLASPDTHTVHCLDAQTGEQRWKYIVGGPIDTPPTIYRGRVYLGGRDGCLYALDLDSGDLAWQLNLFPDAPRIHAFGQLESAQPMQGSVLVKDDFVYALSGRSSFLDGGLHLFKVRTVDGKVMVTRNLKGELEGGKKAVNAMLPDLLTAGEKGFYIGNVRFSYEDLSDICGTCDHLWSPNGLLDDSWLHRVYWVYGTQWGRTWPLQVPRLPVPAGRLLCVDKQPRIVYGFGRSQYGWGISPERWQSGERYYQVHATPIESSDNQDDQTKWRRGTSLPRTPLWSVRSDIEARAMAVTGSHVLIAGPKGKTVFSEPAFSGEEGVALQILDKNTGAVVQEISLPAIPTFDGLIAALDHVYLALEDGSIVCAKPDPVQQRH